MVPKAADLIPHNRWLNRPEYEAAVLRVLHSGHVAQGPEVEAFERELAERFRPGEACAVVSSGTAALYLAMKALHLKSSGRISVPTYSCSALYYAVTLVGQIVQLADCEEPTFCSPRADIFCHTYGIPCWP